MGKSKNIDWSKYVKCIKTYGMEYVRQRPNKKERALEDICIFIDSREHYYSEYELEEKYRCSRSSIQRRMLEVKKFCKTKFKEEIISKSGGAWTVIEPKLTIGIVVDYDLVETTLYIPEAETILHCDSNEEYTACAATYGDFKELALKYQRNDVSNIQRCLLPDIIPNKTNNEKLILQGQQIGSDFVQGVYDSFNNMLDAYCTYLFDSVVYRPLEIDKIVVWGELRQPYFEKIKHHPLIREDNIKVSVVSTPFFGAMRLYDKMVANCEIEELAKE